MRLRGRYPAIALLRILLACAALWVSVLPGAANAHAAAPETAADHGHDGHAPTDRAEHGARGHCHPGLDCSVLIAFILNPTIPDLSPPSGTSFHFLRHDNDRWRPCFDPPPPRPLI